MRARGIGPSWRFTPTCVGTTCHRRSSRSCAPVHPHVRGDDSSGWITIAELWRFTPTCVGTTLRARFVLVPLPVHPHVRGDDFAAAFAAADAAGSPPRAWGRLADRRKLLAVGRFTPTCVGTTILNRGARDDPVGSPPRAWGRRDVLNDCGVACRFTPTCVGTTDGHNRFVDPVLGSPPRAWGRLSARPIGLAFDGSPPRAWGRQRISNKRLPSVRFTPTCVGTTKSRAARGGADAVHPHVRGDDDVDVVEATDDAGSPPRAWGRQFHSRRQPSQSRFTPTCVGTTKTRRTRGLGCPVHPHVRGDDAYGAPESALLVRFTPTCVGTTHSKNTKLPRFQPSKCRPCLSPKTAQSDSQNG